MKIQKKTKKLGGGGRWGGGSGVFFFLGGGSGEGGGWSGWGGQGGCERRIEVFVKIQLKFEGTFSLPFFSYSNSNFETKRGRYLIEKYNYNEEIR